MKIVVSQSELNTALALVGRAVASRPSHPILANVLMAADAATGRLTLTGYDLSLGIQASIPASIETSGAIALPARLLGEIISRLPSGSAITIAIAGDQAEITSVSGSYKVACLLAEDFPDLPLAQKGQPVALDTATVLRGLRATLFASSSDESKQLLTGVHLSLDDDALECAATDGHRLAMLRMDGGSGDAFSLTVPARSLRELERLLTAATAGDNLSMHTGAGQVVFTCGDHVLCSRTLDGTYPNYRQLIPATFTREINVDRRALVSALDRVAVLADQHNNVVKLLADPVTDKLQLTADAQDVGSGSESLAAQITGDAIVIAFNVRYLLDGLKSMASDHILIQCNAPTTPAIVTPVGGDQFTYLVMPVQVK